VKTPLTAAEKAAIDAAGKDPSAITKATVKAEKKGSSAKDKQLLELTKDVEV